MEMDREYQREILEKLKEVYPNFKHINDEGDSQEYTRKISNLHYLHEHGLINITIDKSISYQIVKAKITAKGIDFLEDDGGLSTILGVVTVKIHEDSLRILIEAQIARSDLHPEEKKRWYDSLRTLPADSIKHLTMELLDKGMASASVLLPLIGKYIGM